MQNLADGSLLEEQTEVKLALMRMDKVCVTKIACSNKHSLAVSNRALAELFRVVYKHWSSFHMGLERSWPAWNCLS